MSDMGQASTYDLLDEDQGVGDYFSDPSYGLTPDGDAGGSTNYDAGGTGSPDLNSNNFFNDVTALLKAGTSAYSSVVATNRAGATGTAGYPYNQGGGMPATSQLPANSNYAPASSSGYSPAAPGGMPAFMANLTNFRTPYPYIAGFAVVMVVMALSQNRRR